MQLDAATAKRAGLAVADVTGCACSATLFGPCETCVDAARAVVYELHGPQDWECRAVFEVVSRHYGVDPIGLWADKINSSVFARPRQVSMYLLVTGLGMERESVARLVRRHHSTVAHACELIEDERETEEFDRKLTGIEMEIQMRLPHRRLVIGCETAA